MVSALGFCSRGLGLRPGHFVVSLGKTGYVHSASLQPRVKINKKKLPVNVLKNSHHHLIFILWGWPGNKL